MQFNSIPFLFYFLPAFLAIYYLTPRRGRSAVLAAASCLHYYLACGRQIWPVAVLLEVTALTFLLGLLLKRWRSGVLLVVSILLPVGLLVFFKCHQGGKMLPPGMSFYCFQLAAYLIDVYRKKCPEERSPFRFAAQILQFPKLLSGPLVEPRKLQLESQSPCLCPYTIHHGLQELILGLAMKVLLADRLGGLWAETAVAGYGGISTPLAWLALVAYALRLYFDFYSYSLMAMGLGRLVGYHLPRNFLDPYASVTVSEFYRRWHATLGRWFRDYVYIPLGGSRKGWKRTAVNLAIVWALTGFWHGNGGNYLLWAGFLLALILLEKLFWGKVCRKVPLLGHLYTIFAILISWVPFAIGDRAKMTVFLGKLFGMGCAVNPMDYRMVGGAYLPYLIAGVLLAMPWLPRLVRKVQKYWIADVLLFLLFWVCVYVMATSAGSPFLYFQF